METRHGILFFLLIATVSCKLISWMPQNLNTNTTIADSTITDNLITNNSTINSTITNNTATGNSTEDCWPKRMYKSLTTGLFGSESSTNMNKKYHIEDFKGNWFKAHYYCTAKGMNMATILSKTENDNLVDQLKNATSEGGKLGEDDHFWLGGTRMGQLHYYWLGFGDTMNFTDWKRGEPSEDYDQCIELRKYDRWYGTYYKWNNKDCQALNYVICEEPLQPPEHQ